MPQSMLSAPIALIETDLVQSTSAGRSPRADAKFMQVRYQGDCAAAPGGITGAASTSRLPVRLLCMYLTRSAMLCGWRYSGFTKNEKCRSTSRCHLCALVISVGVAQIVHSRWIGKIELRH